MIIVIKIIDAFLAGTETSRRVRDAWEEVRAAAGVAQGRGRNGQTRLEDVVHELKQVQKDIQQVKRLVDTQKPAGYASRSYAEAARSGTDAGTRAEKVVAVPTRLYREITAALGKEAPLHLSVAEPA